jgi:phenylacetate-CoA ligase
MTQPDREPMTWSRAEIAASQDEQVARLVRHAYGRSRFLRRVWDAAGARPDDVVDRASFFKAAPFITADDVRSAESERVDAFNGLLCMPIRELTVIGSTSGTTGLPQPLPQHAGDVRERGTVRDLVLNGVGPGSVVLLSNNSSRSGHNAKRFHTLGAHPIFLDWDSSAAADIVGAARAFRPTHWWLISGPLMLALQQYERETGDDLAEAFSSIGPTIWGGEPLGTKAASTLAAWGLSVRQMTSLGNACPAVECGMQDGSHTWEDLVLVECLDPETHQPVGDGEVGELVITALADRAAPLIRYRSGDLVRYTTQVCGCGIEHGRIRTVGRISDIVQIASVTVVPSDVWQVVESVPATADAQFQIVRSRSAGGTLAVRVGYDPQLADNGSALARSLEAALSDALHVPASVEVIPLDQLLGARAGVKLRRVVDQ